MWGEDKREGGMERERERERGEREREGRRERKEEIESLVSDSNRKEEKEKGYSHLMGVVSRWVYGCDGGYLEWDSQH